MTYRSYNAIWCSAAVSGKRRGAAAVQTWSDDWRGRQSREHCRTIKLGLWSRRPVGHPRRRHNHPGRRTRTISFIDRPARIRFAFDSAADRTTAILSRDHNARSWHPTIIPGSLRPVADPPAVNVASTSFFHILVYLSLCPCRLGNRFLDHHSFTIQWCFVTNWRH